MENSLKRMCELSGYLAKTKSTLQCSNRKKTMAQLNSRNAEVMHSYRDSRGRDTHNFYSASIDVVDFIQPKMHFESHANCHLTVFHLFRYIRTGFIWP